MDLKGKKLLVLGGASYMPYVREYANQMGFLVYCAGGTHNATMEKYSDYFFLIEATDRPAIVELIKSEHIDGVVSLGNENLIDATIDIAKETGLPFYINRQIWNDLQNKQAFKRHCKEFGISVVDDFAISNIEDLKKSKIKYPVVVKPADSSGSQGVSVCKSQVEAEKAIKKAEQFSRTDTFLVERYILAPEFICTYIIRNGEPIIWMLGDRYMNRLQDGFGGISNCSVFPSIHAELYIEKIHPKMVRLLKKYGPTDGTFFAQGFAVDNDILFFDPALRFCGTLDIIPYDFLLHINPLHWMVNHSLTGVMDDNDDHFANMDWTLGGKCVVQLSLHSGIGTINTLTGIEAASNLSGVIDMVQLLHEGDIVDKPGTLQQVVARAFIISEDLKSAMKVISNIYSLVCILDDAGNSLLMPFKPYGLI